MFANSVSSDVLVNVIWNIVSLQDSFVKIVLQTQILGWSCISLKMLHASMRVWYCCLNSWILSGNNFHNLHAILISFIMKTELLKQLIEIKVTWKLVKLCKRPICIKTEEWKLIERYEKYYLPLMAKVKWPAHRMMNKQRWIFSISVADLTATDCFHSSLLFLYSCRFMKETDVIFLDLKVAAQ